MGEELVRYGFSNQVLCGCCDSGHMETFENLFMICSKVNSIWVYFATCTGIHGPFLQIKETIFKWWNISTNSKLSHIFRAMPLFILW